MLLPVGTTETEQLQVRLQVLVLLLLVGIVEPKQLQDGLQATRTVVTGRRCRN